MSKARQKGTVGTPDSKRRPRCEEIKPADEFYPCKRYGLSSYCRPCQKGRAAEAYRRNPERAKVSAKKWEAKAKRENPYFYRDRNIRVRFKLTPEQWDLKFAAQGGVCAICVEPPQEGVRLAVDHDHACCPGKYSCGKCVRALLCNKCNWFLGACDDDLDRLAAAVRYLEEWRGRVSE